MLSIRLKPEFHSVSLCQVATHAPLLLSLPGSTEPGLRTPALVEFVDIFPTLVEATGFPALELCPEMSNSSLLCTEGSSLLPLVEGPTREDWKQAVFWQYPRGGRWTEHISKIMGYSIRTDEWRYTEWVRCLSKFLNVQYLWCSEL